jgi:hypothetical protein
VWLLIAISLSLLPLAGMSRPFSAACGALALIAAGIAFRRWVLFPVIALLILLTAWLADMEELYRWIGGLLRGVFW